MDTDIEKVCNALLYEGYALFPYRKNSLKNQKRFNFGVLSPKSWAEIQINEHYFQQTEILVLGTKETKISFTIRFLELSDDSEWQTAIERNITSDFLLDESKTIEFREDSIFGEIQILCKKLNENLFKVSFNFKNLTEIENPEKFSRDEILSYSFVSTHTIFEVENGELISLLEAPNEFVELTKTLQNIGVFPVLIGDKPRQTHILSSPIILYDYPEISQSSFENFFDGLEIDELMILNLMALTDDEKSQIAQTDERTKQIIEKIENISLDDLLKLHAHLR